MKGIISTILFSASLLTINAQSLAKQDYKTIQTFLKEFQISAQKKDEVQLLKMVEHYEIENQKIHQRIIERVIQGDENGGSDFAYSDKAMEVLTSELINKFEPLSEEVRSILYKNDEFHKLIHDLPNEKVAMLNHNKAHVLLTIRNSGVKLLFWENLNNFIPQK